jgi:hypothetical protein
MPAIVVTTPRLLHHSTGHDPAEVESALQDGHMVTTRNDSGVLARDINNQVRRLEERFSAKHSSHELQETIANLMGSRMSAT